MSPDKAPNVAEQRITEVETLNQETPITEAEQAELAVKYVINTPNSEHGSIPRPEKPSVLYHASKNPNISAFEPRLGKVRDENEGAQVFATPSKAMASIFMVETDDSWTQSGAIDGVPYIVISDKERFTQLDTGGTIYSLPSNSFDTDLDKGLGELEYTSKEAVVPENAEHFSSALKAMLDNGVKVYFVDKETFIPIQNAADPAELINNLTPLS